MGRARGRFLPRGASRKIENKTIQNKTKKKLNKSKKKKKKTKKKKKKKIVAMFTAGLSVVPDLKNPEHLHLAHSSASSVVRQVQDWLPASAVPVAVHCNKITQMTDTRKFKDFEVNQIL